MNNCKTVILAIFQLSRCLVVKGIDCQQSSGVKNTKAGVLLPIQQLEIHVADSLMLDWQRISPFWPFSLPIEHINRLWETLWLLDWQSKEELCTWCGSLNAI